MSERRSRTLWVEKAGKLFTFKLVAEGKDAGKAYDLTVVSRKEQPAGSEVEVPLSFDALREATAEMGLVPPGDKAVFRRIMKWAGIKLFSLKCSKVTLLEVVESRSDPRPRQQRFYCVD